jgi:two-component system sensor histidine kinase QseC
MRSYSLQNRLLALVLGLVLSVWLGVALMIWTDVRHELEELLDAHLAQAAALLVVQQAAAGGNEREEHELQPLESAPLLHKYAPRAAFQIFEGKRLLLRSAQVGEQPMAPIAWGYATVTRADGQAWRVFATRSRQGVQIYVGEQVAAREDILRAVARSAWQPMAMALPLLALLGWWAVRRGLQPLRTLSQGLQRRHPEALQPLAVEGLPQEMQPLVRALNGLFERLAAALQAERRFTADAAHELRTPIAAIRAQAQVALDAGRDEPARQHALRGTLAGCDRAIRLVEQLLILARLDAAGEASRAPVELGEVARGVLAALAPAAVARNQQLELDATGAVWVCSVQAWLEVLLRNLVDNALRYSPDGARVRVRVAARDAQAWLQVEDSGAGLPPETLRRLGERFYRPPGQSQPGSGLGWSIVRRVVQVSAGELDIARSDELGGLAVTVRWPLGDADGAS